MPTRFQATINEDNEEVYFCHDCHSLHILVNHALAGDGWDGSYCAKCGSTDICVSTISEWLSEEQKLAEAKKRREWSK